MQISFYRGCCHPSIPITDQSTPRVTCFRDVMPTCTNWQINFQPSPETTCVEPALTQLSLSGTSCLPESSLVRSAPRAVQLATFQGCSQPLFEDQRLIVSTSPSLSISIISAFYLPPAMTFKSRSTYSFQ